MTLLPPPSPSPAPAPSPPREKHFLRPLRTAKSTAWPGICSLGVWILCLALLISCGYFGTILALGIKLLKMGDHVQCHLPSSFPSSPAFSQKLPVTYTAFDGTTRVGDLGEQMSKMNIVLISTIFPLAPIILLSILIALHFCRRGMRNKTGLIWSAILFVFSLGSVFNADAVGVDERVGKWYTRCYLSPAELHSFVRERHARWSLGAAGQILGGAVCLCSIFYFALAVLAAYRNRADAHTASIRLATLQRQSPYNEDHLPTRLSTDRLDGPSPALRNTVGAMPVAGLGVGRGRVVVRDV